LDASIFAAIDLGSHTIRLLVAACQNQLQLRPLCLERRVTRLAQGFEPDGGLTHEGMRKSLAVVREYAGLIGRFGAGSVTCGATGVVRKAHNGPQFLRAIKEETGIQGTILSEDAEATLSVKGILSGLTDQDAMILAFDLGGSSTEFTLVDSLQPNPLWTTSVFVGAATVTEAYLKADPPAPSGLEAANRHVRLALQPAWVALADLLRSLDLKPADLELVGTAGTVTTLAAMYLHMAVYQPYLINGQVLAGSWIGDALQQLAAQTLSERRRWVGLEKGREDIILGGALIVNEILAGLNRTNLVVTDAGLLEGLLLDSAETAMGLPRQLISQFSWVWPTTP
jgi:exopolyphosphatase / guanosine-5'-triphosphate,3'-diphosphate pyrophosphatase